MLQEFCYSKLAYLIIVKYSDITVDNSVPGTSGVKDIISWFLSLIVNDRNHSIYNMSKRHLWSAMLDDGHP